MLQQGLVVEDLTSTAEWLSQALLVAFPGMRVRVAESLDAARTLSRAPHRKSRWWTWTFLTVPVSS